MSIQRYTFSELFNLSEDGRISPKVRIIINGIEFGPGISFGPGVLFGGVDFSKYRQYDIAAEEKKPAPEAVVEIKGFLPA